MRGIGGRSEDGMKEKSEYLFLLFFPCPAIDMLFVNNYLNALPFNPLNVLKMSLWDFDYYSNGNEVNENVKP